MFRYKHEELELQWSQLLEVYEELITYSLWSKEGN